MIEKAVKQQHISLFLTFLLYARLAVFFLFVFFLLKEQLNEEEKRNLRREHMCVDWQLIYMWNFIWLIVVVVVFSFIFRKQTYTYRVCIFTANLFNHHAFRARTMSKMCASLSIQCELYTHETLICSSQTIPIRLGFVPFFYLIEPPFSCATETHSSNVRLVALFRYFYV